MSEVLRGGPVELAGRFNPAWNLARPAVAVSAFAVTAGLAATNGGFFPSSWGWASLALFWIAIVGLLVHPARRPGPAEACFAAVVVALAGWTWASAVWSSDRTRSILEGERSLVLVAGVAAVLAIAGRRPVRALLAGVMGAIVLICFYALLTRLFPDRVGGYDPLAVYRLSTPIGYWNGLGLFAAMGGLLALCGADRFSTRAARTFSAASLLVLMPTLYFTFSRGSWLALAAGLATWLALDPRRLRTVVSLLLLAPLPALAVLQASRSNALTHPNTALTQAAHDGHRFALLLVALVPIQACLALALGWTGARVAVPRTLRRTAAAALLALAVLAPAAMVVHFGGPKAVARHGYDAFAAPAPEHSTDLNDRLFSFSGNGRWSLWQVAWHEARAHPVLGGGAGSYEQEWLRNRPFNSDVEDAHNLYLEKLAELGPAGLMLVLVFFAIPLAGALRQRAHPLVPAAAGAFVAYGVHASVDWDWELTGVTLAALIIGSSCLLARRAATERTRERTLGRRGRAAAIAVLAVLASVAAVGLLGNAAAGKSRSAASAADWLSSAAYARRAIRWSPWSSVGWQELGEAQLGLHDKPAARRSLQRAIAREPGNWVLWLDLAAASKGPAARSALAHARQLNPLSRDLADFEL